MKKNNKQKRLLKKVKARSEARALNPIKNIYTKSYKQQLTHMTFIPKNTDISELEDCAIKDERLLVKEADFYKQFKQEQLSAFCVKYGFYMLPTFELIDWLDNEIGSHTAIEIGSGNGAVGRALGIPITDSLQQKKEGFTQLIYTLQNQPVVNYPDDIEELEALKAIDKYKPDTVIGCWITHKYDERRHDLGGNMYGVDETKMLKLIKKYIMVGHDRTHWGKPINSFKHRTEKYPWLYSRSMDTKGNFIRIWEN